MVARRNTINSHWSELFARDTYANSSYDFQYFHRLFGYPSHFARRTDH